MAQRRRVKLLVIDDVNEAKFASHRLSSDEVLQVLDGPYYLRRNRHRGTNAPYLLIGQDYSGTCIALPIDPTGDPVTWRPRTAWPCKPSEETSLDRFGQAPYDDEEEWQG
jgi:hypothetical protein